MTTRAQSIALARVAGYHDDRKGFTRLCIERRVSRAAMLEAWRQGETAKANGVACSCYSCRKAKEAKEAIYAGSGDSIHLAPDLGVV